MNTKEVEVKLSGTNDDLEKTVTNFKALQEAAEQAASVFIPLLREYVKDLTSVRMALAREVQDIIRSSQELKDITKSTKEIAEFVQVVSILSNVLTPELINKIKRLTKEDE